MVKDFEEVSKPNKAYMHADTKESLSHRPAYNYCSSTECVWPKIFGNDLLHTHVEFYNKEF